MHLLILKKSIFIILNFKIKDKMLKIVYLKLNKMNKFNSITKTKKCI